MGILNVLGVRLNYTQGQRDALYEAQINTIRTFPGQGTMIWGQKTAQSNLSALSSVNVRRLIIVTENSIRNSLVKVVFKLNNKFTRLQVFQMIDQFLRTVKAQNGVYDYKIVCDETNNTPQIIDQNQMNVDVYMKPQRSAEVIQLQTIITRTGANFNELVAQGGNFS
jgi:phage tail sheath protein FI